MFTELGVNPEHKEKYLGLTALECARLIVTQNPSIKALHLRSYFYVPHKESDDSEEVFTLPREEFLKGESLGRRKQDLKEGWNMAIDSSVELTNEASRHFTTMDIALRKSNENLQRTAGRLKEIVVPRFGGGFILETGESYHFFGENLLTEDQWLDFLGASLLTSIVTMTPDEEPNIHEMVADYRYIGYSLLRRSTSLRITANGDKPFLPRVVDVI